MSLVVVVPGEAELGPQRFCLGCRSWWPDTDEYFVRWATWSSSRCRACVSSARVAAAAARREAEAEEARETLRATWRRQQADWRGRHRRTTGAAQ